MSIMTCDKHGNWDSDFLEDCPRCDGLSREDLEENRDAAYWKMRCIKAEAVFARQEKAMSTETPIESNPAQLNSPFNACMFKAMCIRHRDELAASKQENEQWRKVTGKETPAEAVKGIETLHNRWQAAESALLDARATLAQPKAAPQPSTADNLTCAAAASSSEGVGQGEVASAAPDSGMPEEPQKIDQTEFGPTGNCQSACLAMLLRLPLSEVPNFAAMEGDDNLKYIAQAQFLHERGWALLTIVKWQTLPWPPTKGYYIAGGESLRGFRHAVIYKDGQLYHDPHPDRTGIKSVDDIDFLYPLNPIRYALSLREREGMVRDAKRYRYMRSTAIFQDRNGPGLYWYLPRWNRDLPIGERIDAAIDAAAPGEGEGKE